MAPVTDIVDLGQLGLKPGGGVRFEVLVPVGDFVFGAQRYVLNDDPVPVTLDISRTSSGSVVRVRTKDTLKGPCMRCYYADFQLPLHIDHSEVHEPYLDDDLASDYVTGQDLDLAALVRDAVGLALPTSISSPTDENGVCTQCESSAEQLAKLRDSDPELDDTLPDPRWEKLRELEL
ncbi:MAG: DUF177 domain-containing protein [Thermoleophilaceae bacterium]|nr:DUF177 domain-containing protein [Thermoleophilaceae bacterium]